ncbi:hypothetical protein Tco_0029859 [Tanacetum coccineum]
MSPNKRKLKHRIKPPKRYEGSVSVTSKRNDSEHETSNDEGSMEDQGTKELKEVELQKDILNEVTKNLNVNVNVDVMSELNENLDSVDGDSSMRKNPDKNDG